MIERRTDLAALAALNEDEESSMKDCCRKYATEVIFNRELEYYTVTFTNENWLLSKLALPQIERYLK